MQINRASLLSERRYPLVGSIAPESLQGIPLSCAAGIPRFIRGDRERAPFLASGEPFYPDAIILSELSPFLVSVNCSVKRVASARYSETFNATDCCVQSITRGSRAWTLSNWRGSLRNREHTLTDSVSIQSNTVGNLVILL